MGKNALLCLLSITYKINILQNIGKRNCKLKTHRRFILMFTLFI